MPISPMKYHITKKYTAQVCYGCDKKVPFGFTTCFECERKVENFHKQHLKEFEKELRIETHRAKHLLHSEKRV
jgi:predicted amidophosphoribosyltransferase